MLYKTCKCIFVVGTLGKTTGLQKIRRDRSAGPGAAAALTGVASWLPVSLFFSFLESVFINDYLKLAEGRLVCNLRF